MEELKIRLETFLKNRIDKISFRNQAEIDIVIKENENVEKLSSELKAHIIEIVDEDTLGKINLLNAKGEEMNSFSLTQ